MFSTSSIKSVLVGGCFALAISTGAAVAAPVGISLNLGGNVIEAGCVACPAGTHLGYEGKYCWRNEY